MKIINCVEILRDILIIFLLVLLTQHTFEIKDIYNKLTKMEIIK